MNLLAPFINGPIAHRTLHDVKSGIPENSWEGLEKAISRGYAIEIDLQLSRDGIPVVFHDYKLNRVTDEIGFISDRRAAELEKIVLKGGQKGIPRFDAFMSYIAGRVPVLIELKDQDGTLGDTPSVFESAVCKTLENYTGPVAIMSFNPFMIERCAKLLPNIPRGLITEVFKQDEWPNISKLRCDKLTKISDYFTAGATFISHDHMDLKSDEVDRLKKAGATILCWTVRTQNEDNEARKIADSVTFENYLPDGF
jgi:glycerophosphoryl diester phosphodiesterase